MKATIVTLTPELAKKYLLQNKNNRTMSNRADVYAEDMKNGRWKENGESIIIDKNGLIKDGQHRLVATITAKHTWDVPVVSDVDPDVMDTIDTGKNRSLSDILKLEGYQRPTMVASIANSVLNWRKGVINGGTNTRFKVTNKIGADFVNKNKSMIIELAKLTEKIYVKQAVKVFSPADVGLFIYIITKGKNLDNLMIKNFIDLVVGNDMDNNTAATWFYKKMLKYKQGKESVSRKWKFAIFVKCWNLYVDGNPPVDRLYFDIKKPMPKVAKMEIELV
jgi:hypothetical protein